MKKMKDAKLDQAVQASAQGKVDLRAGAAMAN
jgi:hypothetical protein